MNQKAIQKKVAEFEATAGYLMKIASDLRLMTEVSTPVLNKGQRVRMDLKAKFISKHKKGVAATN